MITEWNDDVLVRLRKGERHIDYFSQPSDFINRVFNELATGYAILREQKLLAVMGTSVAKAKPGLLENRRSQRFHRNLELNLRALRDAQRVIGRFLPPSDTLHMEQQFTKAFAQLAQLTDIKDGLRIDAERHKIMDFVTLLEQMRAAMETSYVTHLQLTVGFNSLDGD